MCGSANAMQSLAAPVYHWWEWLISSLLLVVFCFVSLLCGLLCFFLLFAFDAFASDERDDVITLDMLNGEQLRDQQECQLMIT